MAGQLTIHIIGSGFGESIILTLPNGKVGVIDCYSGALCASSPSDIVDKNPILRFLVRQLQVDRLAFIAFTHPHEDHGRGISHLLTHYAGKIDEIWVYNSYQAIALERYFRALFNGNRKLPIETMLNEEAGTFTEEIYLIRNKIRGLVDADAPRNAKLKKFSGYKPFRIPNEPVEFHFLGPSEVLADQYEASVADNLEGLVDENGTVLNQNWRHDTVNHNLASPAIVVKYGETSLLLGGDMEAKAWQMVADEVPGVEKLLNCQFVKVSHHGSANGYIDGLYEMYSVQRSPLAVLTPFNRHSHPLPSSQGISHISDFTSELWCTSIAEAHNSLGIAEPLNAFQMTNAFDELSDWSSTINRRPECATALDPAYVQADALTDDSERTVAVPIEWLPGLARKPELAALLNLSNRSVVNKTISDSLCENANRISFTFDDAGNEIVNERFIGTKCGRIA